MMASIPGDPRVRASYREDPWVDRQDRFQSEDRRLLERFGREVGEQFDRHRQAIEELGQNSSEVIQKIAGELDKAIQRINRLEEEREDLLNEIREKELGLVA